MRSIQAASEGKDESLKAYLRLLVHLPGLARRDRGFGKLEDGFQVADARV